MLELLGIQGNTMRVYRTLLQHPKCGIAHIARCLELPEEEVRLRLDELVNLSLLRPSRAQPGQFLMVSPKVGLDSLLARTEADLAQQRHALEKTRAAIIKITDEFNAKFATSQALERMESLEAVRARLEELAHSAETECLSFLQGGRQRQDALAASRPLDESALARGVSLRTIYQDSVINDSLTLEYAQWLTKLGGQTRTAPTLPTYMVIVDRVVALVPIDPCEVRRGAIEVHTPAVIASLLTLFDLVWEMASPLGEVPGRDHHHLSPQERALLQILSRGYTDQGAARQLGLSLRTVRRRMAQLQHRLGARSRFQAGVHAAKQGWILVD